jgi:hypothetical protein
LGKPPSPVFLFPAISPALISSLNILFTLS